MTDPSIQFSIVFQILAAVEGFSAWKGKSFIGRPVANFDEGPKLDRAAFERIRGQMGDLSNMGGSLWKMIKLYCRFKISRFKYLFVSKSKSIIMSLSKVVHNTLGFVLRCSPIISVPLLSVCYIKQIGCHGDNISPRVLSWVFWFIVVKVVCYIICAGLNKLLVSDVSVKANAPKMLEIDKA